jgi:esterase/lipase superfamily enzyme
MNALRALLPLLVPMLAAQNLATSRPEQHLEQHKRQFADFEKRLAADPRDALEFARKAVTAVAGSSRDDPRRADALEMLVLALIRTGALDKMLSPAAELVRIRKTQPAEAELEALALTYYAVALFAADRAAESDQAVSDSLAAYRRAFGAHDIQLAQKLESQAELVQNNMGRKGAADIRFTHPESSMGKLTETVEQLTLYRMQRGEISDAEVNLKRAQAFLEKEIQRDAGREENKAGLAQILILRSGVAGKLGQREQAMSLAEQVRRMQFRDRVLRAETQMLVADSLSVTFENMGDLRRAVAEQDKGVNVFRENQDLLEKGDLDVKLLGDFYVALAQLHAQLHDVAEARRNAGLARDILGDSEELLFAESEVAREAGDAATAVRRYQQALRQRKESTAEATVFFGTTRKRLGAPTDPLRFGNEATAKISMGRAAVLVPGAQFNEDAWKKRDRPAMLPVGSATDEEKLLIREAKLLDPAPLSAAARAILGRARLYPGSALVFIHGYNVSFEQAVRRAAQLVRDLNYDGPTFVFSWPSQARLLGYGTDRATADESAARLAEFLQQVQQITGDAKIHIVAHSMGNRVLLPALAMASSAAVRPKIGEVILAAPAVPQAECARWLDQLNQQGLHRFTLYASKVDLAMWAALAFTEGTVLAGHSPQGIPFQHAGVESIDISAAGMTFELNHDVFASNPVMVEDMRQLLQKGIRPPQRRIAALEPRQGYWYYVEPASRRSDSLLGKTRTTVQH